MSVIRTIKNKNYTTMDNTALKDVNLSWRAKGLFAFMLHRPDDWEFFVSELHKNAKDGRDATAKGLTELINSGYVIRESKREKGQFKGYDYKLIENGAPNPENPNTVNPNTEKPNTVNTKLLSTNNNQVLIKQSTNKRDIDYYEKENIDLFQDESFVKSWEEWKQHRKELKKKLTPLAVKKQLEDLSNISLDRRIAMINNSIKRGYTGLFEENSFKKKNTEELYIPSGLNKEIVYD